MNQNIIHNNINDNINDNLNHNKNNNEINYKTNINKLRYFVINNEFEIKTVLVIIVILFISWILYSEVASRKK